MNDLISRQAAIDICLQYCPDDDWTCSKNGDDLRNMLDEIEALPTVDTVQVVRCVDCKHRDPEDGKCDCGHDIRWQLPRGDDWFCADGERKDNAAD